MCIRLCISSLLIPRGLSLSLRSLTLRAAQAHRRRLCFDQRLDQGGRSQLRGQETHRGDRGLKAVTETLSF